MANWTSGNMFSGGADLVQIDGTNAGGTTGGIRLRREVDWLDFEVDQDTMIVRKELILGKMFAECALLESTLENVRKAWGIPAAALVSSSLELRESSGGEEIEFKAEGPTVTDGTNTKRVYHFGRVVALADGEYNIDRGSPTQMPVTFEVLAEATTPARFGVMFDAP